MNDEKIEEGLFAGSTHYKGTAGAKYFEWQNRNGQITGRIEARKFKHFVRSTDAVLDFGCGGGHILQNLSCRKRVGVEINPKARVVAAQAGIECYEALSDVPDEAFDVVISNHALEHTPFPISILGGLFKKLRPFGVLVLYVPIDDWRTQTTYDPQDISHHLQTWTPQLLGNSLVEAGFRPEGFSIKVLTHAWFPGTPAIYGKLPGSVFDLLCRGFALIAKRRQLLAVARKSRQQ